MRSIGSIEAIEQLFDYHNPLAPSQHLPSLDPTQKEDDLYV